MGSHQQGGEKYKTPMSGASIRWVVVCMYCRSVVVGRKQVGAHPFFRSWGRNSIGRILSHAHRHGRSLAGTTSHPSIPGKDLSILYPPRPPGDTSRTSEVIRALAVGEKPQTQTGLQVAR
jgi:hypothetical protein